jgi:hypothetical protein
MEQVYIYGRTLITRKMTAYHFRTKIEAELTKNDAHEALKEAKERHI